MRNSPNKAHSFSHDKDSSYRGNKRILISPTEIAMTLLCQKSVRLQKPLMSLLLEITS